jgi:NodT family efflux transporter outer membrane factor (OMF) lipoprotein
LGATLQADWWTRLGSPELDQTVALALSNNRTIDIARANVAKAGELVTAARGGLYPQVDAAAGLVTRHYGASFLGPLASTFPTFSAYTGGLNVSYDLDIFGGTRRKIELAAANAEVDGEVLNATRLTVAGSTAITALLNASVRAQIDVAQMVIASDQENMALVQAAHGAGVATQIDVTIAQSQLDRDRALLPPLRQQLAVTQAALAVLVGKAPATWAAPDFDLGKMTLPQDIPLAFPSDLVRARPDIRAAEARLRAASAAVGIAMADLYPRLSLERRRRTYGTDLSRRCTVRAQACGARRLPGGLRRLPADRSDRLPADRRQPAWPGQCRGRSANGATGTGVGQRGAAFDPPRLRRR